MIRDKYNVNVFIMEELINEAISYAKMNPSPIERLPAQVKEISKSQSQTSNLTGIYSEFGEPLSEDEEGFINS